MTNDEIETLATNLVTIEMLWTHWPEGFVPGSEILSALRDGLNADLRTALRARIPADDGWIRIALRETLEQAIGCWVNHYGDNPEGSAVPHHIQQACDALGITVSEASSPPRGKEEGE